MKKALAKLSPLKPMSQKSWLACLSAGGGNNEFIFVLMPPARWSLPQKPKQQQREDCTGVAESTRRSYLMNEKQRANF